MKTNKGKIKLASPLATRNRRSGTAIRNASPNDISNSNPKSTPIEGSKKKKLKMSKELDQTISPIPRGRKLRNISTERLTITPNSSLHTSSEDNDTPKSRLRSSKRKIQDQAELLQIVNVTPPVYTVSDKAPERNVSKNACSPQNTPVAINFEDIIPKTEISCVSTADAEISWVTSTDTDISYKTSTDAEISYVTSADTLEENKSSKKARRGRPKGGSKTVNTTPLKAVERSRLTRKVRSLEIVNTTPLPLPSDVKVKHADKNKEAPINSKIAAIIVTRAESLISNEIGEDKQTLNNNEAIDDTITKSEPLLLSKMDKVATVLASNSKLQNSNEIIKAQEPPIDNEIAPLKSALLKSNKTGENKELPINGESIQVTLTKTEPLSEMEKEKPASIITDVTAIIVTKSEESLTLNEIDEDKVPPDSLDDLITVAAANSPSAVSIDSAKGSSIATDADFTNFAIGDLFWGRIQGFSYWPCMICPTDDDEDLILRQLEQRIEIHVRFFADNARHSWIKRENLLPYRGLHSYREFLMEQKQKVGIKNLKHHFPKRRGLRTWHKAIKEADIIASAPYPERMKEFFRIHDLWKQTTKEIRNRRKSEMSSKPLNMKVKEEVAEVAEHSEDTTVTHKRTRSESPASPAYSPIGSKKRRKTTANIMDVAEPLVKIEHEKYDEVVLHQSNQNTQPFHTPEFQQFYEIMKDFVLNGTESTFLERNIFVATKNFWGLRNIVREQMEKKNLLKESTTNSGDTQSLRRLSKRLRVIKQKPVSMAVTTTQTTEHQESTKLLVSKQPKIERRPIQEVINDIFNLDSRYLFDNVSKYPICKYCLKSDADVTACAKNCSSCLHPSCLDNGKTGKLGRPAKKAKNAAANSTITLEALMSSPEAIKAAHVTADSVEGKSISEERDMNITETSKTDILVKEEKQSQQLEIVVCRECTVDEKPKCFVCNSNTKLRKATNSDAADVIAEEEKLFACSITHCSRFYHASCLSCWPQTKIIKSKDSIVSLRCPAHVCHTCVSDDPKGKFQNLSNAQTVKCLQCPATYHADSTCIPAGSRILSLSQIICPRHSTSTTKTDQNLNVNWCFICVRGGQLICCDTCPTAVHAECLNIALDTEENYICDECESGRMPLYGEMVWAKFNMYRWWPAIILPPTEVPMNIRKKAHNPFDFVIRFFGSHDHAWISRRRVYLYVEGDYSEVPKSKKSIDKHYEDGVDQAQKAYQEIKARKLKLTMENGNKEKLYPQPYVKIKVNRAVSPVKLHPDPEKIGICGCKPDDENPCGPDSNCLNRVLYHECNAKQCPAGERCQNQMFESRLSPVLQAFYIKERGFGLRSREPISAGTFIIEYVGEIINSAEFHRRMQQKSADRDENYYFLYVEKDYIIDAGPKGNMARFMNHSCEPNCETQKWSVNGLDRVGLFAIKDIEAGTELTFNYHWDELLGNAKKICHCGSEKCTGQIGKITKDVKSKPLNADDVMENVSLTNSRNERVQPRKRRLSLPTKLVQRKQAKKTLSPENKLKIKRRTIQSPKTATKAQQKKSTTPNKNDDNNNV